MRFQEDAEDPDFVFVRVVIENEVNSPGVVGVDCRREGEQRGVYSWLLRRHPAYEGVYCKALAFGRRRERDWRDKVRLHGSYIVDIWVDMLWDRDRGETRETFLRRPFGLRCQIRGGKTFTLTLRSNEIVVPAADLVEAVSAYRGSAEVAH